MFVERSSSALYGEVKKLLRERFTLYFHVQKHKKEIVFLCFKIILLIHEEVQLLFASILFQKENKNSNYKNGKISCTTWCVFNMRKMN